jgi:hypothetical protein
MRVLRIGAVWADEVMIAWILDHADGWLLWWDSRFASDAI